MPSRIENNHLIVEWESWTDGWRRTSWIRPGYDCRFECQHKVKGDHGICDAKWIYVVSDGELSLSLLIGSNAYPPSVDTPYAVEKRRQPPEGHDFELHSPWPQGDAERVADIVRASHETGSTNCAICEGGRCYSWASSLSAGREFFAKHGRGSFEQPDSFWEALRAKAKELFAETRAEYEQTKHIVKCPHCAGRGVIDDRTGGAL